MEDTLDEYCEKFRNWGKWGPNDEAGTLNYITPQKIQQAAGLVRTGKVLSLAMPFDANGPQTGRLSRVNPIHTMLATGTDVLAGAQSFPRGFGYADDMVSMPLQCGTQWDGLSHIFRDGKMWNGYSAAEVTSNGAGRNGIEKLRDKFVSRGVLLDIAALKGVASLEPGYAITIDDLNSAAKRENITVEEGDIVLVRTGFMGQRLGSGWDDYAGGDSPGLSFDTAPWLYETRIAALATDTWGVEVRPNQLPDSFQPMHLVMVVNMGLLVGEIFALDELAADCAADGVYEFMFVAPPLPITGGVGSPLNPVAIK